MSNLAGDAAEYHTRGACAEQGFFTNTGTDYLPHDLCIDPRNGLLIYIQARRASMLTKKPGTYRAMCKNHERIGKGKRINRGYRPGTVDFFSIWIPDTLVFYLLPGEEFNGRSVSLPEGKYEDREDLAYLRQYRNAWHLIREHPKYLCREFASADYEPKLSPPIERQLKVLTHTTEKADQLIGLSRLSKSVQPNSLLLHKRR